MNLSYTQDNRLTDHVKRKTEDSASFFCNPPQWGPVELRQKIQELAELRDWSVRKIAIKAGLAQATLADAMEGSDLRVSAAIAVARVMDVPVEWLFDKDQGWEHLGRRPFWMPPDIDPQKQIDARRGFQKALTEGPPREVRIDAGRRIAKSRRPTTPARQGGATGKRRKSGGGGA